MNPSVSMTKNELLFKPYIYGLLGSCSLLLIYIGILGLANSFEHAVSQFLYLWLWFVPLLVGFGVQVGLFFYIKGFEKVASKLAVNRKAIATTAGISGGAMVACCLHHMTDVLPVLGLTAMAMFLTEYQTLFLSVGLVSNFIGITYMFKTLQKHHLYLEEGLLSRICRLNWSLIFQVSVFSGVLLLAVMTLQKVFID